MTGLALLATALLAAANGGAAAAASRPPTAEELAKYAQPNDDTVALDDLFAEVHDLHRQLGAEETADSAIRANIEQMPFDQRRPIALSWVRSLRKALADRASTGSGVPAPKPRAAPGALGASPGDALQAYVRPGDDTASFEALDAEIRALYRKLELPADLARSVVSRLDSIDEGERREATLKTVWLLRQKVAKRHH